MRPVTQNLVDSMMLDTWPRPAAVCDFGLNTQEHYEAIYYPLRKGEITAQQLDEALGDGPALTQLVRTARSNPHPDIQFVTAYDMMGEEE